MKRYLILPGKVWSKTDRQMHNISAEELMRLYSVDPEECVVVHNEGVHGSLGFANEFLDSLLWLAPRRQVRMGSCWLTTSPSTLSTERNCYGQSRI